MSFAAFTLNIFTYEAYSGFISLSYLDSGIPEDYVGIVLLLASFCSFIICTQYYRISDYLPYKLGYALSFLIISLALFLMSRTQLVPGSDFFPDTWQLVFTGHIIVGLACPLIWIPIIQELIGSLRIKFEL
jgi:hypothetical protein